MTTVQADFAWFDVVQETLETTNLGDLVVGDRVNVERSFRVGDEIGGHVLSGHVAATVRVEHVDHRAHGKLISVAVPGEWLPYLMPKGFVGLNGTSLTIQTLNRASGTFEVSLIPETLNRTTFDEVAVGDRLNLEVDAQTVAIVDTVQRLLPEIVQ